MDKKDVALKEAEKERDNLTLKTEAMAEKLKSNNVEFDNKQFEQKAAPGAPASAGGVSSTLIEQYKAKLSKA